MRLFGWNPVDWEEEASLQRMFDDLDTGGDGTLNKSEISELFSELNLQLAPEQVLHRLTAIPLHPFVISEISSCNILTQTAIDWYFQYVCVCARARARVRVRLDVYLVWEWFRMM